MGTQEKVVKNVSYISRNISQEPVKISCLSCEHKDDILKARKTRVPHALDSQRGLRNGRGDQRSQKDDRCDNFIVWRRVFVARWEGGKKKSISSLHVGPLGLTLMGRATGTGKKKHRLEGRLPQKGQKQTKLYLRDTSSKPGRFPKVGKRGVKSRYKKKMLPMHLIRRGGG